MSAFMGCSSFVVDYVTFAGLVDFVNRIPSRP
jgi:hypothetical protein